MNILIVYWNTITQLRATIDQHLYSFKRYSENANCFYVNIALGNLPSYLWKINFDLVIFHTTFLAQRWSGAESFRKWALARIEKLKTNKAVKVALPQDEWLHTNELNRFINEFDVSHVFSVAPPSEWKIIYSGIDQSMVKLHQVLTGYIDDKLINRVAAYSTRISLRDIDIGYRAFRSPEWLGRHGFLKTKIADVFLTDLSAKELKLDISVERKDTIVGDEWYKFLLRCKYFIGVEGGSTVHDPDGDILVKGFEYVKENPKATFEEIEEACFPGMDDNLHLIAISPRHLECCVTRTCQILVEGTYNEILQPGKHYIELKKDFSNLAEVLKLIKKDELRKTITEQAYVDIVLSGTYSYRNFVKEVIALSVLEKKNDTTSVFLILYVRLMEKLYLIKYSAACRLIWNVAVFFYIHLGFRSLKRRFLSKH